MTLAAAIPENEAERLARLQALDVLDTAPEDLFDGLTRLASDVCDVPIALVSLIDQERQWFKSNVGLTGATETSRDVAFCSHAILDTEVMEVPDTLADARFMANPLVTGQPGIRFYAGAPITLSDGFRVGTLCVIDRQPRKLNTDQISKLRHLAVVVAQALEFRERAIKAVTARARSQKQLERLYEETPAMLHSMDAAGRLRTVSNAWLAKLGYRRAEVVGRLATDFMPPDAREDADADRAEFFRTGQSDHTEYQMICHDGRIIDVIQSAILERDENDQPLRAMVITQDISAHKSAERRLVASEARYRALVEDQSELVSLALPDGRISFVNAAYARHFGLQPEAMVGTNLFDYVAEQDRIAVMAHLHAVCERHVVADGENQMRSADGQMRWVAWTNRALFDAEDRVTAIHSVGRDITERKHAERALMSSERFLDRTGQIAGVGGWEVDLQTGIINWSDMTCQLHDVVPGYQPTLEQAIGFYAPEARPMIEQAVQDGINFGRRWDLELPLVSARGRPFWARAAGAVEFENGKAVRLVGAFQDITERKEMENRLAESRELLQVTLDSIGDAVITTDAAGRVQWLNPVAERLTGWLKAEATGQPLAKVFTILNEESRKAAQDPVAVCLAEGRMVGLANDTILIARDGTEYGITDSAAPIRDAHGKVLGAVLVFHDVSEQRRMSHEMSHRARHDVLTGLVNRSEFELRLNRVLLRSRQDRSDHALMYIDLDQFKLVNDACGHAVGDQLLRQVSTLLQNCVRARDTVARLGGDEFGIILEHGDFNQAQRIAQKICDQMEEFRFLHDGRRFRVGASIGLVAVDRRWANTAAVLQAADMSCYAAKEAGRNRVHVWFDTEQALRARHGETQWAARLEQALDENHFVLFAQRIAPLQRARAGLHCELLLRLREADGSLIQPGAFLPAAERFQMASRIDGWVLRQVFDWLSGSAQKTGDIDLIALNLSGQSIGDRAFHRHVIDLVKHAAFDVRKLCFEITETAAMTHFADAKIFIEEMRALGVKIALDDFGAGASSFGYLKNLPVDFIKIDGQFITGLLENPLDHAAVRCFCEVAKVVGVQTVAEFVEREDVAHVLREMGVDYAQGYLRHRPEPIEQVLRYALPTGAVDGSINMKC